MAVNRAFESSVSRFGVRPTGTIASIVAITVGLICVPLPVLAQLTSGDLSGVVTDPSGGTVAGASVSASNVSTGVKSETTSDASGVYHFANLAIGTYDLAIKASGFAPQIINRLVVSLNRTTTQNVSLALGSAQTTVQVTDAASTLDTTSAQIANTYAERLTADLPSASSGQGVINLSLLSAGVATGGGVGAGEGPSVGGQRPRNNNFTIEGVDNNSKTVTGPLVYVPNDAVQEFTVLQNLFQAEFGHSSGGQFNTNVKSGTNTFHGALYEYMNNRKLNAIDQVFQNQGIKENPRYDQNRFGANFGGPIRKNKLFFFGDWEYNPNGSVSASGVSAPTAAGVATLSSLPGISQTNLKIFQQYMPLAPTADQGTIDYTVPSGETVTIPIGTANLAGPSFQNWDYGVASIDYNASDKDQIRGRFIYNKNSGYPPSAEPQLPAFFLPSPTTYYLATATDYHNFSPSVTNELRIGYNRYNQSVPEGNFQFPGLDKFPTITFDDVGIQFGVNTSAPQFTIQNTYQLTDNLTWTKGRHTFKFGFDGRKMISPQSFTQRALGDYEYTQITDFLYDLQPFDFAERSTGSFTYYGDQIATYLYASDSWRVNRHLTADLGLRWEFTSVPTGERAQSLNSLASVPGLISFHAPQPSYRNFAPRIGLAYSPGSSGTTSIRAGFGMAYDVLFDNLGILAPPPQLGQTVDTPCTTDNSWECPAGFLKGGGIPPSASAGTLSASAARAATSGFIPDKTMPYAINWTFGVQHVFRKNYTLEVRYVGNRGVHLPLQTQLNQYAVVTANHSLPVYLAQPSQATLDALPLTLKQLTDQANATSANSPEYYNAGFTSKITSYQPQGWSSYHGMDVQMDRRLTNGLVFRAAYTWSHAIDNSTAEVFSTYLTPRRPQDFRDLSVEKSDSALDHRHRITLTMLYDLPFFAHRSNYFLKNLVGNWEVAPIYTFQSGERYTVQSGIDSNLNGDAVDRTVINVAGVPGTGSTVSPLSNSNGDTVAYIANTPTAQYIQAAKGVYPTSGRNTLLGRPIDNLDLTLVKRFSFGERFRLEFQAQFLNALNHPQFIAGRLNDVFLDDFNNPSYQTLLKPGNVNFNQPENVFSSNPRSVQLALKLKF